MKNLLHILVCILVVLGTWGCEQPESADFQLNHELEVPLSKEKTYPFMGGSEALIDSTSEDYEGFFYTDNNNEGTVHITSEEEFDFGDLNDAIPEIDTKKPANIEVTGAGGSQSLTAEGEMQIDQSSFEFRHETDHFVELGAGSLIIDINSSFNTTVDITFHDIEDESGNKLIISDIDVSEGENYSKSHNLVEHRIKAYQGELDFTIEASTEGESINKDDGIDVTLDLKNLVTSKAVGYIVPDIVMLNTDQTIDGQPNLDIFNDDEANIINIESDISNRISGLVFENPILNKFYSTNLGVKTTIYAIIVGLDETGNAKFLTGKDADHTVQKSEIPSELLVNGEMPETDQVIKFTLDKVEQPNSDVGEKGSNEFNATNSSTPAFFEDLPNGIRFIGVAKINSDEQNNDEEEGTIVNPVIFEPTMGFDLPLDFSADNAVFEDTLEADLGDLPGEGDQRSIEEAILTLTYTNALPLDFDLEIVMLDENGQEVVRKGGITINEAGVNEDGYVTDPFENTSEVKLNDEQLRYINETRKIKLEIMLNTPENEAVKIRKDDYMTLRMKLKANMTSTVN